MLTPFELRVAKRIRKLRILKGLSQRELGEYLGIPAQQIQKYEHGVNRLSIRTVKQFLYVFSIDWNELLSDDVCYKTLDDLADELFHDRHVLLHKNFTRLSLRQRDVVMQMVKDLANTKERE